MSKTEIKTFMNDSVKIKNTIFGVLNFVDKTKWPGELIEVLVQKLLATDSCLFQIDVTIIFYLDNILFHQHKETFYSLNNIRRLAGKIFTIFGIEGLCSKIAGKGSPCNKYNMCFKILNRTFGNGMREIAKGIVNYISNRNFTFLQFSE